MGAELHFPTGKAIQSFKMENTDTMTDTLKSGGLKNVQERLHWKDHLSDLTHKMTLSIDSE